MNLGSSCPSGGRQSITRICRSRSKTTDKVNKAYEAGIYANDMLTPCTPSRELRAKHTILDTTHTCRLQPATQFSLCLKPVNAPPRHSKQKSVQYSVSRRTSVNMQIFW